MADAHFVPALDTASIGEVATAPAPWRLTGRGIVLLLAARTRAAAAPGLAGRLSAVAFVDYATSPVGPYRELLHIPRVVRWPGVTGPTVRDIWVDSEASAVNGNRNWGLTKSVITLDRTEIDSGAARWRATDGSTTLADVTHRPFGPRLPVAKAQAFGKLVQQREGRLFQTPLSLRGTMRLTRIERATFDPDLLIDLAGHRVVAAVAFLSGVLGFHEPRITPIT